MDSTRAPTGQHTSGVKQVTQSDTPEQLLNVFKAAALSVTKLYKTSALVESRARTDGYQECLEDLLLFLDKANIGLNDGEGWSIRKWATERLDGRDVGSHNTESEDEVERIERTSSPEVTRTSVEPQQNAPKPTGSSASSVTTIPEIPVPMIVPTQDTFNFQSSHPYPNIETLDLSDSRSRDNQTYASGKPPKSRFNGHNSKAGPRGGNHVSKTTASKRRWDFDDFFGGCLDGKDPFNGGGKRSRHA